MIFVSGAPVALKKKVNIARQRMFLFADNVEPPGSTTAMADVINRINASRGFCAKVNADMTMSCVRSAGWKSNQIYYNYVPSLSTPSTTIETSAATLTQTIFDVFGKYYSMGRTGSGTWTTTQASLLETLSDTMPPSPLESVMILPPFDGTALTYGLSTMPNVSLGSSRSWTTSTSLGIITGYYTETITTLATHIQVTELNFSLDKATVSRSVATQSNGNYVSDTKTVGPRTLSMSTATNTVVRDRWNETVVSNSTGYTAGPYRTAASYDTSLIYGTGSKANTPDYALTWGMMPIVGQTPDVPMYAVILKAEEDFEQTGLTSPGARPVMKMKQLSELLMDRKFLM